MDGGAWWAVVHGVAMSRTRLSDFTFTFHFHTLEKEMATHSSVLAWRIPGTGKPGGLPSMGLHRVGHDWSDLAAAEPWRPFLVEPICFFVLLPLSHPFCFSTCHPLLQIPVYVCLSPLLGYEFLESRNLFFFMLLFVFGHVGPFSSCVEQWLLHSCGVQAPHCVASLVVERGL